MACIFRWNWLVVNFAHAEIGLCCKAPARALASHESFDGEAVMNDESVRASRRALRSGQQDEACASCWSMESSGLQSMRQVWRGDRDFHRSPYATTSVDAEWSRGPEFIEIVLDDLCNLECAYCFPERSTRWQAKLGVKPPRPRLSEANQRAFWLWLKAQAPRLKRVMLTGGEPVLSPYFAGAVQEAGEALRDAAPGTFFGLITNLSYSGEKLAQALAQLRASAVGKEIAVSVSGESFGQDLEKIRYGLRWSQFQRRFEELLAARDVTPCAVMSVNQACVPTLATYVDYLESLAGRFGRGIRPVANYVLSPASLDARQLGAEAEPFLRAVIASARRAAKHGYADQWREFQEFIETLRAHAARKSRLPAHSPDLLGV